MARKTAVAPMELPEPVVVNCREGDLDALLAKEWLLSNKIGAYASSSVLGCNTRRYHALLVGTLNPPVSRIVTLSNIMETLVLDGEKHELATFEFPNALVPEGYKYLQEFRNDVAPTFVYRVGKAVLVKQIMLADNVNAVAVRYTLQGGSGQLRLKPFVALRDFHHLRLAKDPHQIMYETQSHDIVVQDRMKSIPALHLRSQEAKFEPLPQWWNNFRYRVDLSRGQDGFEDLYSPGEFVYELGDGGIVQLTASLDEPHPLGFETTTEQRRARMAELAASPGRDADATTRRLAMATDAFVVQRSFPGAPSSATILAGFPWFADWGRDTFIALPGLLLSTQRFDLAKQVFRTFSEYIQDGMIPNHFDDYSTSSHYNSFDASLWFVLAAERYVAASADIAFWRGTLMPAVHAILTAYHNGTRFDIRADHDGLICGGSPRTQLTWMDAKLGDEAITPRHGKPVEVNALWYCAHRIMAERCRGIDDSLARQYHERAELIGPAFVKAFWNPGMNCLYDCIQDSTPDASLRPNQIFAVSLPHSPLSRDQQAGVVAVVRDKLLTPVGLRTLSPEDGRYRRRYGGSWESRDRAYHQGTVWPWLIGPFIEAYLKVENNSAKALVQAKKWLEGFDAFLDADALGYICEISDGDPPHLPHGCFAQAWSVAEVLRAKRMVAGLKKPSRRK